MSDTQPTFNDRAALWSQLQQGQQDWDLVIVGGGIIGAGILREAARRGVKALLVEQRDFAWGTSSHRAAAWAHCQAWPHSWKRSKYRLLNRQRNIYR